MAYCAETSVSAYSDGGNASVANRTAATAAKGIASNIAAATTANFITLFILPQIIASPSPLVNRGTLPPSYRP
ncbi:MAG: hypothetical protein IJ802_00120 [Kiritimatiellae bacterium]|nr:hypothetical protein [Kiritimatiellia bacterium]